MAGSTDAPQQLVPPGESGRETVGAIAVLVALAAVVADIAAWTAIRSPFWAAVFVAACLPSGGWTGMALLVRRLRGRRTTAAGVGEIVVSSIVLLIAWLLLAIPIGSVAFAAVAIPLVVASGFAGSLSEVGDWAEAAAWTGASAAALAAVGTSAWLLDRWVGREEWRRVVGDPVDPEGR